MSEGAEGHHRALLPREFLRRRGAHEEAPPGQVIQGPHLRVPVEIEIRIEIRIGRHAGEDEDQEGPGDGLRQEAQRPGGADLHPEVGGMI